MTLLGQLVVGSILGILVALLAWRAGALDRSGAVAAALEGALIFGLGGVAWAVLLLGFFISSSALSKMFRKRKQALNEKFSKGSRRDWGQVLANGGLGAALAVVHVFLPSEAWPWWAFAGAMAAVNADTWATELGVLSRTLPRRITDFQSVERGESGAVSLLGSTAAFGGAGLIALLAVICGPWAGIPLDGVSTWAVLSAATIGGVLGSFFDSLLGATVQAMYWCSQCEKETERYPLHLCGTTTAHRRGWRWMDNDVVNGLASLVGAVAAILIALVGN